MSDPEMSISTVSRLLGIPVPTIRSWERRYGFPSPSRTGGRHRRYGATEVEQLRALRDLVTKGHSTREAVARAQRASSRSPDGDPIEAVVGAAMRLEPSGLRDALDRSVEHLGVEDAIRSVALPAMRDIGAMWKTGSCDVEHEHLATEVVRAWLASQVATAPPPSRPGAIVLACGPRDLHTIGLEAFAAILARRGWSCRVLGAMTPSSALVSATRSLHAVAAVVTAQRRVTRASAVEAIEAVASTPGVRVFFAGDAFAVPAARRSVPGVYLGEDVVEAAEVLESAIGISARRRS